MSGGFEAAGDAVTGAMIARAVEPVHGEAHGQGEICLNCGATLTGPYCAACGQSAHLHRSLIGLWHDIAHGVFHFEGKVWRTLPMLAWRPGDLTRRYIHGERAQFVSPLALFLFSVFLMFAVFEGVGGPIRLNTDRATLTNGVQVKTTDLKAELVKERARLAALQAERAKLVQSGASTKAIDARIDGSRSDVQAITAADALVNGVSTEALSLPDNMTINTGTAELDDRIRAAIKNPKLLLYKLQSSAYKFAWGLIPLSLPLMALIFAWRRQYKLYDHAIFVTYSLSFVMVLLVAMALLAAMGVSTGWALFLVPAHMFRQLKQAYGLTMFSALWRTMVLLIGAGFVLMLFIIALLALGLLG